MNERSPLNVAWPEGPRTLNNIFVYNLKRCRLGMRLNEDRRRPFLDLQLNFEQNFITISCNELL